MSKRKRQREAAMQAKRIYDQDENVLRALQQLAKEKAVQKNGVSIASQAHQPFMKKLGI